ncbi:MAG: hypothetical protein JWN34_3709 [Bryobacterales bacterium]|nr:hypothetical protein [Bryobacterales bacterium]
MSEINSHFSNTILNASMAVADLVGIVSGVTVVMTLLLWAWRKLRFLDEVRADRQSLKRSAERFAPKYERAGWL